MLSHPFGDDAEDSGTDAVLEDKMVPSAEQGESLEPGVQHHDDHKCGDRIGE